MRAEPIHKAVGSLRVGPNLVDDDRARASFSWADARASLDGLPGRGPNIAHECVDRHALSHRCDVPLAIVPVA